MNRTYRKWLLGPALAIGLIVSGPHSPVLAAAAPAGSAARSVTVNFVETDIVDVLKALSMQSGSNIVAGPECKDKKVTASFRDMDLEKALELITRLNNLAYESHDGTYVVSTASRLQEMFPAASTTQTYTLTSMSPEAAVNAITKMAPGVLAAPQGTSMIVLTGGTDRVRSARMILAQMEGADMADAGVRQTRVYELKYLNPLDAQRMLASVAPDVLVTMAPARQLPGTGKFGSTASGMSEVVMPGGVKLEGSGPTTPGSELKETKLELTPGDEPRALMLTGYPAAIERASELLSQVDVAPRQVEITARVVDLSDDSALRLGAQYDFGDLDIREGDADNDPNGTQPRPKPLKFGQFFRVPFDLGIDLDAVATSGNNKLLANPRIAALDGRPARIFIGDTVTVVISRSVTTTGENVMTEKIHAGINLLVTPRVGSDGTITLEVHPSVSAITGIDIVGGIALPQVSERSVDTTIRVRNGETVALGGLIRESEIKTMTKVPILGDIPILGELFRHRNNTKTKSDLTVFLTTKILED